MSEEKRTMRIWTASPYSTKTFTDAVEFINKICVVNNIDIIIDIRKNRNANGVTMDEEKITLAAKTRNIKYLYLGDYLGQNAKTFSQETLETAIKTENGKKSVSAILKACRKFNVLLLGHTRKYKNDVRYGLAHILKNIIKEKTGETMYIMHIGS